MNSIILTGTVAGINLLIAVLVYLRGKNRLVNLYFALFIAVLVGWSVSVAVLEITASMFWSNLTIFFGLSMGMSFYLFVRIFPQPQKRRFRRFTISMLLFDFLLAICLVFNLVIPDMVKENGSLTPVIGPAYPLLMVFSSIITIASFYILFLKYRESKGIFKDQIKYLSVGLTLFFTAVIFGNVILPSFGISQIAFLGPVFSLFFIAFTSYAIIRHRLMDIRLVVARSVIYLMLLLAICGLFISIVQYAQSSYARTMPVNQNVLFIFAGFVVAFGFQPLRSLLEKITDRVFFRHRYNPQELLRRFNEGMSSIMILDPLLAFVFEMFKNEIKVERVALVLVDRNKEVAEIRQDKFEISDLSARRIFDLCRKKKSIIFDELEESKEKQFLRELEVSIVLPLVSEYSLKGILVLGDKKSGDMFTAQDIQFLEILAPEVAIAFNNALLFEERDKRVSELSALNKLAFSLNSNLNLRCILDQAIEEAIRVTGSDSGSIMLLDEEGQDLTIEVSRGIEQSLVMNKKIKVGEGIAGWVVAKSEPLILVDGSDARFQKELKRHDIKSSLTLPLKTKEKVIGVLTVNRKTSSQIFGSEDTELIMTFAAQVAVAIENAKLYKDLQSTFLGTISALAASIDAKDPYTFGHSNEVVEYAVAIAERLLLSESQVQTIRVAAALHDIGKIGIDGSILNKPGKLSLEEREIINSHPAIAANILSSLDFLKDVVPIVLFHHERFDGRGYPTKISGHAIPIGARIISVADSFNAMISKRSYRPAMSLDEAKEELKANSGTQFDPVVVDAFLAVLDQFDLPAESKPHSSRRGIGSARGKVMSKAK